MPVALNEIQNDVNPEYAIHASVEHQPVLIGGLRKGDVVHIDEAGVTNAKEDEHIEHSFLLVVLADDDPFFAGLLRPSLLLNRFLVCLSGRLVPIIRS